MDVCQCLCFPFLWVEPLGFVRLLRWVIISNRSGQTPGTPNIQSIISAVRVDCHSGYDGEFFLTLQYFTLVHPCLHQSWSVSRFTRHGLYSLGKVGWSFCLYVSEKRQRELRWNSKEIIPRYESNPRHPGTSLPDCLGITWPKFVVQANL